MENFSELKLSPEVSKAIEEMGYTKPTPIQAQALPILMEGETDFLGMAATGTGKTAAFGIPLLERVDAKNRTTQAVVLCPTRELALQVSQQITLLGKYKKVHAQAIYGGAGYSDQIRGLQRGACIVVATPGRLIDHLNKGNVNLDNLSTIVLDEADEMISMGFKDELEAILKHIKHDRCRTWLFAATLSPELRKVVDRFLKNPKQAQVNRKEMLPGTVRQIYYTVREKNKPKGLTKLIDHAEDFYGLIFGQTKSLVSELTEYLKARGYRADSLHGDKSQAERERTMKLFREKSVNIVVCTDVAARGIDVKELTHVINFSMPRDVETYVHRIGRTGRSGKEGFALSLVGPKEIRQVDWIEKVTKSKLEAGMFPTRKDISAKKLARLHPKFKEVLGHEKAREVLDTTWTEMLEGMSKLEIAGRFLALSFPDLFDDREQAEEIGLGTEEERPYQRPAGRFRPRSGPPSFRRGGGEDRENRSPRFGGGGGEERDGRGPRFGGGKSGGQRPWHKKKKPHPGGRPPRPRTER